jgi:son of sevenless-like protein
VINDIQRWQSKPHNFHPLPSVLDFLGESLRIVNESDSLWNLSLELEPQETWGDRQVRLSLESGLL